MLDNLLLDQKLPTFILELFHSNEDMQKNTTILSEEFCDGKIYKILIEDKTEKGGYESGILYLTKGSKLKETFYTDDDVDYTVIFGEMIIDNKSLLSLYRRAGVDCIIESKFKDTAVYYSRRKIEQKVMVKINEKEKNVK